MENDQKVLIETAITTDDYFEARNALDEIIDQEGLVEVALNTKISNHAIMAVNRIKNGNVDLFAVIAKNAKVAGFDAIHDTVHEMARDEARHGKAFEGLLKRYFG